MEDELFPPQLRELLLANGRLRRASIENVGDRVLFDRAMNLHPLVKIYMTTPRRVWLLTDLDPIFPERAFGLCDLGTGLPLIGSVYIDAFTLCVANLGLPIYRDPDFKATKTLREYAIDARLRGRVDDDNGPRSVAEYTEMTDDSAMACAVHTIDAQDDVARTCDIRESEARLDQFLRQCEEKRKPSDKE
jgi:hypothetical protein